MMLVNQIYKQRFLDKNCKSRYNRKNKKVAHWIKYFYIGQDLDFNYFNKYKNSIFSFKSPIFVIKFFNKYGKVNRFYNKTQDQKPAVILYDSDKKEFYYEYWKNNRKFK